MDEDVTTYPSKESDKVWAPDGAKKPYDGPGMDELEEGSEPRASSP